VTATQAEISLAINQIATRDGSPTRDAPHHRRRRSAHHPRVTSTDEALRDLDEILTYIAAHYPWDVLVGLAFPFWLGYAITGDWAGALTGLPGSTSAAERTSAAPTSAGTRRKRSTSTSNGKKRH